MLFLSVLAWTTAHTATANPPCPSTEWLWTNWVWVENWTPDSNENYRVYYQGRAYTWLLNNILFDAVYYTPGPLTSSVWRDDDVCTPPPCAPHQVEQGENCVPCAAGTENFQRGATCTNCAPGKFKAFADATACQNCDADQESVAPFTECRDCDAGKYSLAGGVCWAYGVFEDRNALQTALFGCVGACNSVHNAGTDNSYCYSGSAPWTSGTGADCDAGSTHGAIDAWDVSRVTTMMFSECSSSRILSLSHLSDARLPLPSAAVCSLVGSPLSPSSPAVFFPYSCLSFSSHTGLLCPSSS